MNTFTCEMTCSSAGGRPRTDAPPCAHSPAGNTPASGFRVQGSGFRVQGSRFTVQGLGETREVKGHKRLDVIVGLEARVRMDWPRSLADL